MPHELSSPYYVEVRVSGRSETKKLYIYVEREVRTSTGLASQIQELGSVVGRNGLQIRLSDRCVSRSTVSTYTVVLALGLISEEAVDDRHGLDSSDALDGKVGLVG
jgi:hypothetical protein